MDQEEAQAWAVAPLSEQREAFGLKPTNMPGRFDKEYTESYGGWETDFITMSRNTGLPAATVRQLRQDAINLALQVDGKPLSDDVVDHALGKHRLTQAQRVAIKRLWRQVEGGGGA